MGNPPRAAFGYYQKMVPSGPDVLPFNAPRGGFPNGSSGVGLTFSIAGNAFCTDPKYSATMLSRSPL
jgi:hypothetical protein